MNINGIKIMMILAATIFIWRSWWYPSYQPSLCSHNILFYFWWYLGTTYAIEWFFYMSLCDIEIICPCKTFVFISKRNKIFFLSKHIILIILFQLMLIFFTFCFIVVVVHARSRAYVGCVCGVGCIKGM